MAVRDQAAVVEAEAWSACPAGALEITDRDVRFVHFSNPADVARLFVMSGVALLVAAIMAGRK